MIAKRIATIATVVVAVGLGGSALASDPKYEFTWDWVSKDSEVWLEYLSVLRDKPEVQALEIGSYEGRSAIWFLENILTSDSAGITCVDIFNEKEIEDRFDRNIRASGLSHKVRKARGDSRIVLKTLEARSYDFVYIDGCHKASCILSDAVLSFDLTKFGGIIIFDDYGTGSDWPAHARPATAIDAFLNVYQDGLKLLHKDDSVVVVRRIVPQIAADTK